MPFDGGYLHKIKQELDQMLGARVDKIGVPSRDCIVFHLRTRGPVRRLLIAVGSAPRIHFTSLSIEYPAVPPMFCLLLRKHLGNGRLVSVTQKGLDRVLTLGFEATSELGDPTRFSLVCELMGRQGNVILVGEDGKIVDALHRVDFASSAERPILSGLPYEALPAQGKLDLTEVSPLDAADRVLSMPEKLLSRALLDTLEGASPLITRELARRVTPRGDRPVGELTAVERTAIADAIKDWAKALSPTGGTPLLINGEKPDFTFLPPDKNNPGTLSLTSAESYSALLTDFYRLRESGEGVRHTGDSLKKQVTILHERLLRKRAVRLVELEKSRGREELRLKGDLLSANLYRLKKGMTEIECEDYTGGVEPFPLLRIPLDPLLSPSGNVQKYYGEYRKAASAEAMLHKLLSECEAEISYIASVLEALERATTEGDIIEIRDELVAEGYLKSTAPKGQKPLSRRRGAGTLPPLRYRSSDGFLILCGRNNTQNDQLTLKTARPHDLWFHIQKSPGSHVILVTEGVPLEELPDRTVEEAAMLAAVNSSGRESSRVAIDYTLVKNIKKPGGSKPGMVVYDTYYSLITSPDHAKAQALQLK